ncbi:MAG: mobile mystery protein A [Cellvibrio sp.]|uniref:mobile mystery protein A n=1 Tax=Cellvibrio sp. TaxID=1965322 RepID=UPI0031B2536D
MKQLIIRQYQQIVDSAAQQMTITMPPEGWLRTVRSALGMSGAQLARKMGLTRSQISQSEKNELSGAISLKTMQALAEAMNCRVVYALVPNATIEEIVANQAQKKAEQLVRQTHIHMALESQALNSEQLQIEEQRIKYELIREMPNDLWNDN